MSNINYYNIKPSFLNATRRSQKERLECLDNKEEMLKHLKFKRSVKKMCDKIVNCTGHKLLQYFLQLIFME